MTPADGVAPVMNLPAHLFSRIEYYMDGHKISDLQDHIPQIDTMKNRLSKSQAWFNSVGARSCFWDPNFAARQAQICPDYQVRGTGVLQHGKLTSERALVLDGFPVNLKGQQFKSAAEAKYVSVLGALPQVELLRSASGAVTSVAPGVWAAAGIAVGNPFSNNTTNNDTLKDAINVATWTTEEEKVRPRWVRCRSGGYTYYCVTTTINDMDAKSIQDRLSIVRPAGDNWADAKKIISSPEVFTGINAPVGPRPLPCSRYWTVSLCRSVCCGLMEPLRP